jgi:hypothetical protein
MNKYDALELEAENFLTKISKNIEKIREERGFSKLHVSRELGFMYPDHYSRMELRSNGKHFNLRHIYKLSKILNVDVQEFFI